MVARLTEVADRRFGPDGWTIDRVMRQIPDHFHAHARDPNWWYRVLASRHRMPMRPGRRQAGW
jgi:hypothetical protein